MAALGTAALLPAPPSPWLITAGSYRANSALTVAYPVTVQLLPSPPNPLSIVAGSFGVGGTQDCPELGIPTVGVIWPPMPVVTS